MSASGRGDPWGVSLEIGVGGNPRFPDDERSRNVEDVDPAALSFSTTPRDDAATTHHSWLLPNPHAAVKKRKRYVDLGCFMVSRPIFLGAIGALLLFTVIAAIVVTVKKDAPPHHHPIPPPDNYTVALHKALMFFNAQRSGPLPRDNNVTWRGNSGMKDGMSEDHRNLVGGFYDAGSAAKYNFPASFAMTMLSWSVIEYRFKYEAMGELDHVKEIIKWGVDYLLKSFNASAPTVDHIVTQVGGGSATDRNPNDDFCWMRPEDVDYPRQVHECYVCSDLAAEMAAALASASIVFKDSDTYSRMLVHRAEMLWKFAKRNQGVYGGGDGARFYSSTGFFDEFVWSGTWLYFATGNNSYLSALAGDIANGNQSLGDPAYGVLSWDKKLIGAKVLLTRLRMFLSPGYPYEEILAQFHNQTNIVMCSYLPVFTSFGRTKGGMILLNNGEPQPLQYVVSAAFLASLYGDYLETVDTPGWFCGPDFYSTDILRDFARTQINYVLGVNPRNMSYVVGFGSQYPKRVHHRGASIPKNGVKYGCQEGWRWRDSNSPNPHVIVGAMVSGPDKQDGFHDDRKNYNYTEPTLAANAGLVAALVSLSGEPAGLDRNNIFSSVEPMFPKVTPSSPPWQP